MKKTGRAVAVMALLAAFGGLSGCVKVPAYTAADIQSVSVSCGHMDYSHSYSFCLRKTDGGWLLDADYAVDTEQPRTVLAECPVTEEDAKDLFAIVQEQDVIGKLRRCKKPKINVQVADKTTYYTSVLFTDGAQLGAAAHISDGFITGFFTIAGKYADTVSEADHAE